jgi:hypothetical protein
MAGRTDSRGRIRESSRQRDLEIAFNDPKYYTRPFAIKTGLTLIPDSDVLEYVCNENETDRPHMK